MGLPSSSSNSFIKPWFAESHQHKGISQIPRLKPAGLSRQGCHDGAVLEEGGERTAAVTHHVSSSRPCLEGGRACWSRSGKPDARPGTDASSRAIFTNQWVAVPEQEPLLLSKPGSPRSARIEGSGQLLGPRWEPAAAGSGGNSGVVRRAQDSSAHRDKHQLQK